MNKNKIRNLIYLVFTVLVVLNVLVNAPNLNPMYFEGAVFWCFLITVYLGVYAVFRYGEIIPISYGGTYTSIGGVHRRHPQKALYCNRCAVGAAHPGFAAVVADFWLQGLSGSAG